VAPELLRRSVEGARAYDPTSLPFWGKWLERNLPATSLRGSLLALVADIS
jgi:hypothetical protein